MNLVEQLIRDEGLRLKPYRDTAGKLTIGIGRNLDDVGISHDEALTLLQADIERASRWLRANLPWVSGLDEVRQAAMINMAFNLGSRVYEFAQFLRKLQSGDYESAASEMLDSLWASQVGPRADRLAQQIRTGQWI